MKPTVRRLISLLLVFVLLIGTFPQVYAASTGSETPSTTDPPETTASADPSDTTGTDDAIVPAESQPPEEEVYWLDAINKGESALNVVYDEYFTQEQLAQMPATYNSRATAHGTHLQACLVWLEYDKTFDLPYQGGTKTISSVALHRVYNAYTGDWDVAYCIEPGVPNANSGYGDDQLSADAFWGELSRDQQYAIGLAVLYGSPNNPDLRSSDVRRKLAYELATYIIIQEICLNWRNSTGTYACTNSGYIDAFGKGELYITSEFYDEAQGKYLRTADYTYGEYDEVMYAYNLISGLMAKHNTIPSFTSRFANQAPTHPLVQSGSKWTTTLTDTNNILSEYAFTNTSDLSFSVSGNQLTVTANGRGPYKAVAPTRTVPDLSAAGSLFRIWKTAGGSEQEMITLGNAAYDPVPAFFNLGPANGTITGTKITETGADKGNITMQLLQGGSVIMATTTDGNGNFSFSDVPAGDYTLHEQIDSGSKYYCANNDQTVTVTPGGNTAVSITNNLKRGNISGTKNTETGADKGNITIQLMQGSTVIATATTNSNGAFAFNNIPVGSYTVHEVLPGSSKYYPVNNDQSVTVTHNGTANVTITNNLKRGNISGTKATETGADKGNITIQLLQGSTVIATATTDSNGAFAFNNIPIGTYTVHEVLPNGSQYYPANNDQSVTVTHNGTANVTITNNLKRGNISGTKATETGADKGNITIQLLQGSTVIATATTNSNGAFAFNNIPIGTYTIHEVLPGDSKYYPVNNDQNVTVTFNGTANVTITNNLKRGNISGTKNTETGADKGNITIQLMQGSTVVATTTTNSNGAFAFNNIPIGTYTVHEVLPGDSKYYPVNNDQNVTVTFNGTANVTITNNLKRGDISGTKTTDTGVDKKGWTIQLIRDGSVVATTTTDDNGAFAFKSVPIGTYTVHEVVPAGAAYLATTNDVSVTVPFNGTVNAEIKNTLIRGNVRLVKLDSDKLTLLSGAVFSITDARGQTHTMTETSPGVYYAPNVAFGKAVIKEIKPPKGFLLNEKEYTVNITENGKTYDLTDAGYDGIPNAPIPGSGTAGKVSTNGITAEGYALSVWTDRTGSVAPVTHYLKSDADGKFFVTDPTFEIPSGTKNYTVSGLYDGDYKITEHFSSSSYQAAYTQSIKVTVTDSSGDIAFEQTYGKSDLTVSTVDDVENYTTPVFAVTGLNGGGSMTITVTNHPIPGSVEIKKTATDGDDFLNGYAFRMEHSNADEGQAVSYWRSDENGKFYLTDSKYAEVTENKNYVLGNVYDGTYTIRELIGSSTWQYSRMDSIRFTVTDKAGNVTFDKTISGADIVKEENDFILSQPISITGVNGGGKLTIEVINTPLPAQITIDKVNHGDEPLAGAKFTLEWSKDGTTWAPVAFNSEEKITIGGCQSPNLDADGCLVSDSDGKLAFTGLHPMMQYRLIEVEAPNGYVLLAEPIQVGTLFDDFKEHFRVVNGTVYSLPNTGSTGTSDIVICGAAVAALAVMVLIMTLYASPRVTLCEAKNNTHKRKERTNMKKRLTKLFSIVLVLALLTSFAVPTFAADWKTSVIDNGAEASITLYKYDWTNAVKDGVWDGSYVSTGVSDGNVEDILSGNARENGDLNGEKDHPLANGNVSNGYAVSGVEFSYLRVADIAHFTENITNGVDSYHDTRVLYGFNKAETADLLTAIGLAGGAGSFTEATSSRLPADCWWYESDTLNAALSNALANDVTGVKDALETYINGKLGTITNGAQADLHEDDNDRYDAGRMLYTNKHGYSSATNMETGLYILVETQVPEMVTETTNPFFVSLPMTSVNGGMPTSTYAGVDPNVFDDGGHEWLYDVTLYPKNETGIVTLDKQVREVKADGGKNDASDEITDGFAHNATASTGDLVEYQIISTLPSITSQATRLTTYCFNDTIASGLTYTEADNVKLQWYTDKDCTKLVDTWTYDEGYFSVTTDNDNHKREIALTEDGLAIVNGKAATSDNVNSGSVKYAGYSNYTVRITYTAKLDSDKTFIFGDKGNTNQVILTWRRTSSEYYDTLVDDCHVYSYALDLTKKFSDKTQDEAYGDGSAKQNMFNHAKFKVRNATEENGVYTEGYFVIAEKNEAEGIWYVTGHSDKEEDATIFYPLKPSNYDGDEGHIIIKGLEDDTYELTEIETANGYTLLKDRITVKISVEETDSYCSVYENEVKTGVYQNDGHYNYTGCPDLPLANIPQQGKAHHLLTASSTVDGNAVSMNADYDPSTGNAIVVGTNAEGEYLYSENAIVPLTVVNTHGFDLPQTGQTGARHLPLIGAMLFAVACVSFVVVLFVRPRRKAEDE